MNFYCTIRRIVSLMVRCIEIIMATKGLDYAICSIFHMNKGMTQQDQNTEYFHIVA